MGDVPFFEFAILEAVTRLLRSVDDVFVNSEIVGVSRDVEVVEYMVYENSCLIPSYRKPIRNPNSNINEITAPRITNAEFIFLIHQS